MEALNVSRDGEELSRHLKSYVFPVTVFISVETFVGFFGNIAILLVYSKQYRHVNFRCFVLALACVDLVSCCTTLPGEVFSHLNWYNYKYTWICKVKTFFNLFTAWGSASVLLTLAIDRYRKVCHPCDWQIRVHVAFRLCICCLLISAIISTPVILLWGTQSYLYEFKGENFTVSVCEKSGDYASTTYPLLYAVCMSVLAIILIVVTMTLNLVIIWRLFCNHSVKCPSVRHYSMEILDSGKVRQAVREETMTTDDNIVIDEAIRNKKPIVITGDSVSGPSIKLPTVSKENPPNNITPVQELSTDVFSTDDDITSDFVESVSTDKTPSEKKIRISNCNRRSNYRKMSMFHRKYKTMIMLILTLIFSVTMTTYIVLTGFVAKPGGILKELSNSNKTIFFFFWRLYFVNTVINPILYGFMDPGFRSGFMHYVQRCKACVTSCSYSCLRY